MLLLWQKRAAGYYHLIAVCSKFLQKGPEKTQILVKIRIKSKWCRGVLVMVSNDHKVLAWHVNIFTKCMRKTRVRITQAVLTKFHRDF